jgi:hypothetical protein
LGPLFEGLQSDKIRNLKTLEELVLTATEFIYDINSKSKSSSSHSINHQEDLHRSPSPFPRSSFEEYHEVSFLLKYQPII